MGIMNRRYIAGVFAGAAMATSLVVLGMNLAPAGRTDVTLTSDTEEVAEAPVDVVEETAVEVPVEEAKPVEPEPDPDPTTTTTEPDPDPTTTSTGKDRVEKVEQKVSELDSRVDQLETQITATTATTVPSAPTVPSTPTGPAATPTTMTTAPDLGPPNWSFTATWEPEVEYDGWLTVTATNSGNPGLSPNLRLPVHYEEKARAYKQEQFRAERGVEMEPTFYLYVKGSSLTSKVTWRIYLQGVEGVGEPTIAEGEALAGEVIASGRIG